MNPIKADTDESICVMCMNDQQVLYEQNRMHTQSVASISKVMTAIIAIEKGNLSDVITVDTSIYNAIGSSVYLKVNEQYTLEDLLYGLMLRSGNDAAIMIAKHIGGSEKKFVQFMNKKAKQLKLNNTIFHNASGLDEIDGGNISNACDMAVLTSYAMENEVFQKIVNTKYYSLKNGVVWKNKNRFLKEYEYATGGKTGYTKKAGRTLITTSQKDDLKIVVVSLRCSDDFNKHKEYHQQIYEKYTLLPLVKKGVYHYKNKRIRINEDYHQCVLKDDTNIIISGTYYRNQFIIKSKSSKYEQQKQFEVIYE